MVLSFFNKVTSREPKSDGVHGHTLLLNYLGDKDLSDWKSIVEIGSTRESIEGQGSTKIIAHFAKQRGLHFISVDMDPDQTERAQSLFKAMQLDFSAIHAKGEEFLKSYSGELTCIYLDAFDYDHGQHSSKRKDAYMRLLGVEITNENAAKMHLECAKAIVNKAEVKIIGIDDTWRNYGRYFGKGALAVPYLLQHSYKIVEKSNLALVLERRS
jgi:hypothetical protein